MRIQTINDLIENEKTKLFYVCLLTEDEFISSEREDRIYTPVYKIRNKCRIVPCKMVLERFKNIGGYRMEGNTGESFDAEEAFQYKFKILTGKEAKKLKLPDDIHGYNRVYYLPTKEDTFFGFSWYNKITMYDGTKYSTYTENHIESMEEDEDIQGENYRNDEENHIDYGPQQQIRVFTDLLEAQYYLKKTLEKIVDRNLDIINKQIDKLKKDYFILENNVNNNSIEIY